MFNWVREFAQAQSTSCKDLPRIETTVQVSVNGTYAIWLHARGTSENAAKAYLYFEGDTNCEELNISSLNINNFAWISGSGGVIKRELTAGTKKFYVAVEDGSFHAERAVVTGNVGCIPTSDGTNCLEQDVAVQVQGIESGQRFKETMNVSTTFSGAKLESPKVAYYFDNSTEPTTVRTSTPFCLSITNGVCGGLNLSFLSAGDHRLKIVMSALNMSETTQSIPFIISPLAVENEPVDTPGRTVSETPLPTAAPTPVKAIVPEKKNTVVIGTSTQTVKKTVTGSTIATVTPAQPITYGDTVTYKVADSTLATKTIGENDQYDPSATLDLSNYADGDTTITAEIERPSGLVESYTTPTKVDNSSSAQTKSWLNNGGFLRISLTLGTIALAIAGFFIVKRFREKQQFAQMHNVADYEFVQPEQNQLAYALPPVAGVLFAVGAIFSSLTSAASARVGTIVDFGENTVIASGFMVITENGGSFIKLSHDTAVVVEHDHEAVPTTPSSTTPTPSTPTPNPAPTPPTTPIPAPVTPAPVITAGTLANIPSNFDVSNFIVNDSGGIRKGHAETGNFRFFCHFSHMAYDDPIVYPGKKGASHLHTFFGNTAVNANTTYESLRTTGDGTCDGGPINRTGYWVPAVYNAAGKVVLPKVINIYYKSEKNPMSFKQNVTPLPRGLRMIAGYDMINMKDGRGKLGEGNFWGCGGISGRSMPNCGAGSSVRATIQFPSCWDGKNIDTSDHRSHMAYPVAANVPNVGDAACPASHPVHIPEITVHVDYPSDGNSSSWRLASDMSGQTNGESMHADWWGGWDEEISNRWFTNCLKGLNDAANGNLCDGKLLKQHGTLPTFYQGPFVVDAPPRP